MESLAYETLRNFQSKSVKSYWTGVLGSIVSVSDGSSWVMYTQENETTEPMSIKYQDQVSVLPHIGYN